MSKRIISLILCVLLLAGSTPLVIFGILSPQPVITGAGISENGVANQCRLGETFSVDIFITGAPDLLSITLPFRYDTSKAVLIDKDGNDVTASSDVDNVITLNPALDALKNESYPVLDVEHGYLQLMFTSKLETGAMLGGVQTKLCTLTFRSIATTSDFKYWIANKTDDAPYFDPVSFAGIIFFGTDGSSADPILNVPNAYLLTTAFSTFAILVDQSDEPPYVAVILDDIVVVSGVEPLSTVRLYDDGGTLIGIGAAGLDGVCTLSGIDTSGGVNATQQEVFTLESAETEAIVGVSVLTAVAPNDLIVVPYGTTFAELTSDFMPWFPVDGTIAMTIPGHTGLYLFPAPVNPVSLTGELPLEVWACDPSSPYDPLVSDLYDFYVLPALPTGVTNPDLLKAKQPVFVAPENLGTGQHVVICIDGDSIYNVQAVDDGDSALPPADPGSRFLGWYILNSSGILVPYDFDDPVTKHLALIAVYDDMPYTVVFKDFDGTMLDTQPVDHGDPAVPPLAPTRVGHTFTGWDKTFDVVTDNMVVTAVYAPLPYTVTYEKGSHGNGVMPYVDATYYGGSYTLRGNEFLPDDGYAFDGWRDDKGNVYQKSGGQIPFISCDVVLTAQWVAVTDNSGGGYIGGGGYSPATATLIINCEDEKGNIVHTQPITSVTVGRKETANAPDLEGYELDDVAEKTITVASGTNVVTFKYISRRPTLEKGDHYRYILGYPDGTVQPEGHITREEVASIFYRLLTRESRKYYRNLTGTPFPDVAGVRWSSEAIMTVKKGGIINGRPGGDFDPGSNITRAEFAVMAVRFESLSETATHPFSDVSGHWAERYIATAVERGWIHGYPDGTFLPDQYITRTEAMKLINSVLERNVDIEGLIPSMIIRWPDLPVNHWGYFEVQEATISHTYVRRNKSGIVEDWTGYGQDIDFDLD